jgi:stearoyl-CoA desaturase (delta-9 desaturase)
VLTRSLTDREHAFPHDYRSGPSFLDWDPSKWIVFVLHSLGFVTALRRAREGDVREAAVYMHHKYHHSTSFDGEECESEWDGEVWSVQDVEHFVKAKRGRCVILLHGFVVDVTTYLGEHVSSFIYFQHSGWNN